MPDYEDKMRLNRYLMDHGECNALTEYLILKGYSDDTVESGLESFVKDWEKRVEWIRGEYREVSEEYYFDIWRRSMLFLALEHASPEQIAPYRERLKSADEILKKSTIEDNSPCDIYPDEIENPNRETHWWLYRLPKNGFC
jgi:hypothetical protein